MLRLAAALLVGGLALGLLGCGAESDAATGSPAGTSAAPAGKACPSCPEGKCVGAEKCAGAKKCANCPEGECACRGAAPAPVSAPASAPKPCCPGH